MMTGFWNLLRGLSGKALLLTVMFVLLGELLLFLPSIANFRIEWLKSRLAQAEIAALAAEAAPDQILDDELRSEILMGAGVIAVSLTREGSRQLMLRSDENVAIEAAYDLRSGMISDTIPEALATIFRREDKIISVIDVPPHMSGETMEIALHEAQLHKAMRAYAWNIALVSLLLSLIVAGLVFAALYFTLVRPMRRLSQNMLAFATDPENPNRIIKPSDRQDEIGMAESQLGAMQAQLQASLHEKAHLAALGLAASKVAHDLRNMLTSAQLISDRLASVNDPTVQRFAPKLISSLDRAINFLVQTIRYGKAQELPPQREPLRLREIVEEVIEQADLQWGPTVSFSSSIENGASVFADREQLIRILTNLVRNASQALMARPGQVSGLPMVAIKARATSNACEIRIEDNGPGIPHAIREKIFEPFQSADRQGGTGLGLAISAELVRAHGGMIEVASSSGNGTVFRIVIPGR